MMGVAATLTLLGDAITQAETFIDVFVSVYSLVILLYIVASWLRLPYSPWLNRIQRFLYDVSEPYLRLFRRFLPSFGPLDLSPLIAIIVLVILGQVLITVLNRFN
jgi:YggT family protein